MKYHVQAKHRGKISGEAQPKITDFRTLTKDKKLKLYATIVKFIVQNLHAFNGAMGDGFRK